MDPAAAARAPGSLTAPPAFAMEAHAIALPVLEPLAAGGRARVLGSGRSAAYLDLDGFVVAVTARGVPLMPCGIALGRAEVAWPARGGVIEVTRGGLRGRGWAVTWPADAPPVWDPRLWLDAGPGLRIRGAAILAARGVPAGMSSCAGGADARAAGGPEAWARAARALDDGLRDPFAALLRAVAARDARDAAAASLALCGRGPGLTPEGDDLLAGVAVVVAAAGLGFAPALLPQDLRERTTSLSATLLELAAAGSVVEPVHALLDLTAGGERRWRAALARLERIGHSTGPAYAVAVGATAIFLDPP